MGVVGLEEAVTAYLQPLLEKHSNGKTIVYEDLSASWQAADNLLKQAANASVVKHVSSLHKSQLLAYRSAARDALKEWVESVQLPASADGEAAEAYGQRCVDELADQRPNWKIGTGLVEKLVNSRLRERAAAALEGEEEENQEDDDDEEGEEAEEEDNEEGDRVDAEEDEKSEEEKKAAALLAKKKRLLAKKKQKGKAVKAGATVAGRKKAKTATTARRAKGRGGSSATNK